MKFAVVLVLAVCLPAVFGWSCQSLTNLNGTIVCDLDGAWRTSQQTWFNNDDAMVINQAFDGEVEWNQEYDEYLEDLNNATANPTNTQLQNIARTSCKEAIPDRVYHFRFERSFDGTKYETKEWLYRGFPPAEEAWDRYCTNYVEERVNAAFERRQYQDVVVERYGRGFDALVGAWMKSSTGHLVDLDTGVGCKTYFRPKKVTTRCLMKNDNVEFPTEKFCNQEYESKVTSLEVLGNYGGAQTSARFGCQQYTWDSDSNDDNIEDNCDRMWFINQYRGQNAFKIAQIPGAGTGTYPITSSKVTSVNTPKSVFTTNGLLCEYRVSSNSWGSLTSFQAHRCQ